MAHVGIHNPATGGDWDCPEGVLNEYLERGWVLESDKAPDRYAGLRIDDLKAEIARRNEGRAETDLISASGNKADLIAALVADDTKEK